MKKYYATYGNFANQYRLYWAEGKEMEKCLPECAERITKKEAMRLCRGERWRRKYDQAFSGYADAMIYPANDRDLCVGWNAVSYDGYVVERG